MTVAISASFAQNLSVGGAWGTNLTPGFQPFSMPSNFPYANTRTLSGGGVVEWSFSRTISLEADGLFRRLHAVSAAPSTFSVVTWQFPVLAKYRFSLGHLKPFVEAGPSLRATGNLNDIHPSHYGFTAGAGVERQLGRLRIAPVVRYTRWAQDVEVLRSDVRTKTDQLEVLVAFLTQARSDTRPLGMHVSLGLAVGTNLTSDFGNVSSLVFPPALANVGLAYQRVNATFISSAGPRSFARGPQAALELPKHLSVEVQAIYRPLRSSVRVVFTNDRRSVDLADHRTTWEFPVLARYRLRTRRTGPFVEAGPVFRLVQDIYGAAFYGEAAGAGVETRVGRLTIAPGIRLTHWAQHNFPAPTDPRRNEIAFQTGFLL